jgi:hypothetical protein
MVVVVIAAIGSATPKQEALEQPISQQASERPDNLCQPPIKKREIAASFIRAAGYDCVNVDTMCSYTFSEGYTVFCDHRYQFEIENHGGKWSVRSH